ncbi:accessory Sec system protein Asp1 [Microbacterium stercoris]|uniref:Accessory Sec system protein Asp1 n=1 Tax=Microbacterium stercoris TaxID=2820289 RepID=A0A939TSS5_9MICO|nr:accessory Sec system protein Asp1 [Microbacterium stercoris]MBO3662204.1 accessory Sec system protein Asp1 [Microbacterium stercoris]
MIHFIPSWYNPARRWYATDNAWFHGGVDGEADDTATRVRIFRQGAEETRLVVLNYAPSLRRFLHSHNIFDVPYWSFFDELQGLEDDYTRPIDFLQLEWPDDVSFFYNPFIVTVMRGAEVYARVHLARAGTLQSIRYYGDDMPTVERIYDDRGFLSSVLMHDEAGRPMTQYYLSRGGDVILSEDVPSGRIDIVQAEDERLRQQSYDSWEALMSEFLGGYMQQHSGVGDTVVLAVSEQHNDLVASCLGDQMLVLSRSAARAAPASSDVLVRAAAVFSDFDEPQGGGRRAAAWERLPTLSIYPLERRATFGASTNESTVCISLFADDITPEQLDFAIAMMAPQLVEGDTRLLVCTFRRHDVEHLRAVRSVIAGYQHLDLSFLESDETTRLSVDVGIAEGPEEKIQLTFVDGDADLIRTMARTRVLVDLGARPDIRLAAAAVDAGVPQINRTAQALVTHEINGYVIGDDAELGAALAYFLSGLEHWNRSLVQCRVLEDLFSAPEVLTRWELIKEVATYARPADRP